MSCSLQQSLVTLVWTPNTGSSGLCSLQVRHEVPHLHRPALARGQAALPRAQPVRWSRWGGSCPSPFLLHQLHVQDREPAKRWLQTRIQSFHLLS